MKDLGFIRYPFNLEKSHFYGLFHSNFLIYWPPVDLSRENTDFRSSLKLGKQIPRFLTGNSAKKWRKNARKVNQAKAGIHSSWVLSMSRILSLERVP